jgi:hypothetical protein
LLRTNTNMTVLVNNVGVGAAPHFHVRQTAA